MSNDWRECKCGECWWYHKDGNPLLKEKERPNLPEVWRCVYDYGHCPIHPFRPSRTLLISGENTNACPDFVPMRESKERAE